MGFDNRARRLAGRALLGVSLFGGGVAALASTHSTAAALGAVAQAVSCGTSAACFTAKNTSSGPAISGTSAKGIGIVATGGKYGLQGSSANGGAGVVGTTASAEGVYGFTSGSSGGTGVYGSTGAGYGVYGTSRSGSGFGVVGYMTGSGTGSYGFSQTGYGLEGITQNGNALYSEADGAGTGAYISTNTGYGLISYTGGSVSVYGRNSSGNAGDLEGSYIGLVSRAPASGGFPLVATDQNSNNLFYVDGAGNVSYHGGLFQFSRVSGGATVKAYSAKSTAPTVEDTGTAQMIGGSASVKLDPTFAASIDARTSYRVFVTPNGDTRGLFVTAKTPSGFLVRESQGGRSSVSFDYRIVATSLGEAGTRMAVVDAKTGPHAQAPTAPILRRDSRVRSVQAR